jgi:hypothetical protein
MSAPHFSHNRVANLPLLLLAHAKLRTSIDERSGKAMIRRVAIPILLLLLGQGAQAADKLTIVKAGPVGEIASLAEANEIRVVFSEPMVVLGKIPRSTELSDGREPQP